MTKRTHTPEPGDEEATKDPRESNTERWRRFVWLADEIRFVDIERTAARVRPRLRDSAADNEDVPR